MQLLLYCLIVLEIAIRRSEVETQETIFDKCSKIMAYAGGVVIMRKRLQALKEVFTSLLERSNKMEIEINKKDKICDNITKHIHENNYVKIGTHSFEAVKDYTYLGTILLKINKDQRLEKELHIQTEDTMQFFLHQRDNQYYSKHKK